MNTLSELKANLTDAQALAAHLLTENEFAGSAKRTQEEIAEELGITRRQLYNWKNSPDFIKYQSALSSTMLESHRAEADAQLLKLIRGTSQNGIPSVKGLTLYYELLGVKQNKLTVQTEEKRAVKLTDAEVAAGLDDLMKTFNKE